MTRIILADDHTILREGIRALLVAEPDFEVVGEASTGLQLLDLLATTPADVVLLDLTMPELDGFATIPLARLKYPQTHLLVLSMLEHERYVAQALDAGAAGYILKNAAITEILHAIRTVAMGHPFLCTEIGLEMLRKAVHSNAAHPIAAAGSKTGELSKRELEVLRLLATDLTGPEIAGRLFMSVNTFRTHTRHIFTKLDVTTRRAAVSLASSQHLL